MDRRSDEIEKFYLLRVKSHRCAATAGGPGGVRRFTWFDTDADLEAQVTIRFDCIRIEDEGGCDGFGQVPRARVKSTQQTVHDPIAELNRPIIQRAH
ncbi:MAG: hypothetical protein AAGG38_14735 [Planctomycetota bacterium]